ncbi:hypothetical protein [Halopseudomonas salegens]|uniref:Uncharacterized protein n=1 Tax=Halopseudomonas salegens TaxID=1434072 RepID=A0A1H2E127_9GAMM|nr:hypothetical protein [Halopseudomonas salegens]SDT88862.1 hypothetical protein SAMN05216210_0211 [Halopseudomonas salegens]
MDENIKRQMESLKPCIDDAPTRVRSRKKKSPIGVSILLAVSVIGGVIYMADRNGWAEYHEQQLTQPTANLNQESAPVLATDQSMNIGEAAEAAKDIYLEQVNEMLSQSTEWGLCEAYKDSESELGKVIRQQNCKPDPVAEIEWIDDTAENSAERQTVFNDANYRPSGTVNTISMPGPEASQQSTAQRAQPYVTVVEETRASCGLFKEGSTQCRQHKARMRQHWQRQCEINQSSHACAQANRYDLR